MVKTERLQRRRLLTAALVISSTLAAACSGAVDDREPGRQSGTSGAGIDAQATVDSPPVVFGTYLWNTLPVGAGGFVTGIVSSTTPTPSIYARTDVGGAYRWDESADRWQQLLDARSLPAAKSGDVLSVDSIAVAPSLGSRVYLALGNDENPADDDPQSLSRTGRILVSDDSGTTWRTPEDRWFISGNQRFRTGSERLAVNPVNPDHVLFGSSREGLFQSMDAGSTWQQVPLGLVPTGVSTDPKSDQVGIGTVGFVDGQIYAGVAEHGIYVSSDQGASWRSIRELELGEHAAGATEVSGDLWLALNRTDGQPASVAIFDPTVEVWSELPTPATSPFVTFAVDPADPRHIVLADEAVRDGHLWSSVDGGQQWTAHDVDIASPQIPWLANTDLDQYMSTGRLMFDRAGGTLWFAEGMAVWRTADFDTDSPTTAPIVFTSAARGIEETVASSIIAPPGGSPIGAVADRQGFLFDDPSRYPPHTLIDETFVGGTSLDYSGLHPEVVAWVGAEYHIYYSDARRARGALSIDRGQTWTEFEGTTQSMFGGEIAVSAVDPQVLVWLPTHYTDPWEFSRSAVGVYFSHDGGESWTHVEAVGGTDAFHRFMWWFNRRALAADKVNANFYLMSDDGRFLVSSDGGAEWQEASHAPPCIEANACHVLGQLQAQPDRAERLWASVGKGGLYRTDDSGRSAWHQIAGVDEVTAFGFGAPMPGATASLALFLFGRVNGSAEPGLYRSDDDGLTWVLISQFPAGSYTSINSLSGDLAIPGRVYIAFSGTGFAQGDPTSVAG